MGKKNKKEKKQEFIAKITEDGKVNKKEAQKAAKKGISLAQIERATIRSFRDEQRSYQRTPTERRSSTAPSYSPLLISRGASNVFSRPKTSAPAPAPEQAAPPEPEYDPASPPTLDVQGFPDPPAPDTSAADALAAQIAEMQAGFTQRMQEQQAMFQQMQASQAERMEALQQQMLQSQIAQQPRPTVAGVQMAQGAAGTPMQIARRGVSGAFGRRGMRISGLNV